MKNEKFEKLGLKESILKAIDDMGFEEPSHIQEKVIPTLLEGKDVIGQAQTGTGKTLAFAAPIINNMKFKKGVVKALVLAPTRELALQVNDEINRIAKHDPIRTLPVYGGSSIGQQINALKRGVDIVVGTPGRVLDLIQRKKLLLGEIDFLILDEADEMLNMGFIEDIESIIKNCSDQRQTLMFSATMPKEIKRLGTRYMKKDLVHVSVVSKALTVNTVTQYYYEVKNRTRFESLCRIIDAEQPSAAIVFCRTKKSVDELSSQLTARGYNADGMHGDLSQHQRIRTLNRFKDGQLNYLIATDVAARGIDVEDVSHVINYELPQDIESYVHRIGRTGRANKTGIALSLVTPHEYIKLKNIEKATKVKVKRQAIPTIDDIFVKKNENIIKDLRDIIEGEDFKQYRKLAEELDEEFSLVDVAAALLHKIHGDIAADYTKNDLNQQKSTLRLFFNIGKKDKLTKKDMILMLEKYGKVSKKEVGQIDIFDTFTFINVSFDAGDQIMKNLRHKKYNKRRVRIEVAKESK